MISIACPCRSQRSTGRILKAREGYAQGLAGWNIGRCRQALSWNAYGLMAAATE